MRKKIPAAIIIFASLSSIIILPVFAAFLFIFGGIPIPFIVFWIITITFLIRLKNRARIAYIIIHIILALITVNVFINITTFRLGYEPIHTIVWFLIFLPFPYFIIAIIFSYFIVAIKYFLRSDIAKLFKQ